MRGSDVEKLRPELAQPLLATGPQRQTTPHKIVMQIHESERGESQRNQPHVCPVGRRTPSSWLALRPPCRRLACPFHVAHWLYRQPTDKYDLRVREARVEAMVRHKTRIHWRLCAVDWGAFVVTGPMAKRRPLLVAVLRWKTGFLHIYVRRMARGED